MGLGLSFNLHIVDNIIKNTLVKMCSIKKVKLKTNIKRKITRKQKCFAIWG